VHQFRPEQRTRFRLLRRRCCLRRRRRCRVPRLPASASSDPDQPMPLAVAIAARMRPMRRRGNHSANPRITLSNWSASIGTFLV
jgi:hypothetical protein